MKCHCGLVLASRTTLNRHIKTFHKDVDVSKNSLKRTSYVCSVCSSNDDGNVNKFREKSDFFDHLRSVHGWEIKSETKTFPSFKNFLEWKSQFEAETRTVFVTVCGTPSQTKHRKTVYYNCHRSGFYKPRGSDVRQLKAQGSKKINGYCPAQIKVHFKKEECVATVIHSHWGHSDELPHLTLTPSERMLIAGKIASKIPFSEILNDVRSSVRGPEGLSRIHLTTRKDLHNIAAGLKVSSQSCPSPMLESSNDSSLQSDKDGEPSNDSSLQSEKDREPSPESSLPPKKDREPSHDSSLQSLRDRIKQTLAELAEQVDRLNSAQLECLAKQLVPLLALQTSSENTIKPPFNPTGESSKRKMKPQPLFIATENKRKKKKPTL